MILQTKTAYISSQKACATDERRRTLCLQNYKKYVTIGFLFSSFNVKRLDGYNEKLHGSTDSVQLFGRFCPSIGCYRHGGLYVFHSQRMGGMVLQLALVCPQKQVRNAGKRAFREAMCAMKRLPFAAISWE